MPNTPKMFDFSVIREFRTRAGLTLAALASASGVSAAVLSKLERNRTEAELGTLFRIARAFGMHTTDLLALAESRTAHRTSASAHRSGDLRFQEVRYANCRLLLGEGLAGGRVSEPKVHQDDFEVCWVLGGEVRVTLPHEQHALAAGQCIQFDAILPHTYSVLQDCRILIVHLRKEKRF